MRYGSTTIFVLLFGLAAAPVVLANDDDHDSSKSTSKPVMHSGNMAASTASFVKEAVQGGMAEVEMGRLAVMRAQDPDIKQFAQRMVDDHARANDELEQLAERRHWKLPKEMSSKQKMCYNRLHDKAGADFDREYAKAMVKDHDEDVKMFEAYAEHGKDTELKAFASNTVATLQEHQQMARANASKLGVDVASKDTIETGEHAYDTRARK